MPTLFADTFYFIALLDSDDPDHARAIAWSRQKGHSYVTTEFVLIELADAFNAPEQRREFAVFQDALRTDPKWRILPSHRRLYAAGLDIYRRRRDKHWQLTDCISFAVMHRLHIHDALTGDRHFTQAGFNALLAQSSK
jgi:predicted nucleic acid-binding protein